MAAATWKPLFGEFAGKMHTDLLDAVDWAIAQKVADPRKIAIAGASYGGYATLVGLSFTPDTFACGVDMVGVSDLATLVESFPAYWGINLAGWHRYVGNPAIPEQRARMLALSPISRVDAVNRPLLVIQTTNDVRVNQSQADTPGRGTARTWQAGRVPPVWRRRSWRLGLGHHATCATGRRELPGQLPGRARRWHRSVRGGCLAVLSGSEVPAPVLQPAPLTSHPAKAKPQGLVATALTLVLALLAGALCQALHTPLPWMLGPLLATAAASLFGLPTQASNRLRNAAQWVIGTSLGLYFTPAAALQTLRLAHWILAGSVWALLLGYAFHWWLRRAMRGAGNVDAATAYFSAVIGGASEMAAMAERNGCRVDLVAAAHSLRLMLVVVTIPFAYRIADIHGLEIGRAASLPSFEPLGFLVLIALTATGVWLLQRMKQPNPWVLGSLLASLAVSASGHTLSGLPPGLSQAAQAVIGVTLGTRFSAAFLHTAPRWLTAVAIGTFAMMGISALASAGVAQLSGLDTWSVLLGNSPGGIAEMCLTAKVLQLSVPVVTAFHVVRYAVVLLCAGPVYRRWVAPRT